MRSQASSSMDTGSGGLRGKISLITGSAAPVGRSHVGSRVLSRGIQPPDKLSMGNGPNHGKRNTAAAAAHPSRKKGGKWDLSASQVARHADDLSLLLPPARLTSPAPPLPPHDRHPIQVGEFTSIIKLHSMR